jgi:hypothetical protein
MQAQKTAKRIRRRIMNEVSDPVPSLEVLIEKVRDMIDLSMRLSAEDRRQVLHSPGIFVGRVMPVGDVPDDWVEKVKELEETEQEAKQKAYELKRSEDSMRQKQQVEQTEARLRELGLWDQYQKWRSEASEEKGESTHE